MYLNRVEDLRELEEITGVENFLEGKICIARYGKIYRGNKVHNCQSKGAIGIYLKSLKRQPKIKSNICYHILRKK